MVGRWWWFCVVREICISSFFESKNYSKVYKCIRYVEVKSMIDIVFVIKEMLKRVSDVKSGVGWQWKSKIIIVL